MESNPHLRMRRTEGDFWAPDLQIVEGRFARYFESPKRTLSPLGVFNLGVAFSASASGPYADMGLPLWDDASNTQGTVDVHYHEPSQNESQFLLWKANDTS